MSSRIVLAFACAVAAATVVACGEAPIGTADARTAAADTAGAAQRIERGRYLAAIMDCSGCHNSGAFSPHPEAGHLEGANVGHEVPGLGVFYPPNLTPHPDAGLGRWSEAQIAAAVRTGVRPDGRELSPAMPWRSYAALSDDDTLALAAYLKSLPPSPHRAPPLATPETATAPYLRVQAP